MEGKKGRNEIDAMYEYEELYNTTHDMFRVESVVSIMENNTSQVIT